MGKYDNLTREELIARLEKVEQIGINQLQDHLDGEERIAQALILMLQNYDGNYEEDIMRIILERYQADRAFLFQFDWEKGTNSNIYEVNANGISSEIEHLQNLPNEALSEYLELFRQGKPLVVNDVACLPETSYQGPNRLKQIFHLLQLKSAILFPMYIWGKLWGYVGMETVHRRKNWSQNDIEWLQAFTNILSLGVSQRFFRTRATQNEQRFTELFRNMPIGYIHHRMIYNQNHEPIDYEFLDVNPAFERLSGLSREECIGKTALQVRGRLNPELLKLYADVAQNNKQAQFDYETSLKKYFYSVLYSPRQDEFISLFYDITGRIKATEQTKRNEKKLRMIFDNLPVGTIAFKEKGDFISANDKAFEMFGLTHNYLSTQKLQLKPEHKCQLDREGYLEANVVYDPATHQEISETKDLPETTLFLTLRIFTYTNNEDQRPAYLLIAIDNTKIYRVNRRLSKTEKALKENLMRLSLILETGKIYPWFADLKTETLEISNEFYKAFGQEKHNHPNYSISDFLKRIHPDDLPNFQKKYSELLNGDSQRIKMDIRLDIFGQGYLWSEINAGIQKQKKENQVTKLIGFLTLIQERKDNERNLIEALRKAEESDRLKSAFLANVSHEIRTPLNAIVGFSELIASANDEEEKNSYLDIVKTNNQLLVNLIHDILDLSKIEAGEIELQEEAINVYDLCVELCEMYRVKANEGVKIILANTDPLWIYTDRNRLIQLYSNLITNAIKNTLRGTITVGYEQKGKQVEFYVRDTGKGISPDKQKVIFNRFEKLDYHIQGFGLGLAIFKAILENMNGTFHFTSEVGKGTECHFTLPHQAAGPANLAHMAI